MSQETRYPIDEATLLKAIADVGTRFHVLRHLETQGTRGELHPVDVAKEEGLDPESASVDEIAETFVEAFNLYVEETTTETEREDWLNRLEDRYGDEADEILGESQ